MGGVSAQSNPASGFSPVSGLQATADAYSLSNLSSAGENVWAQELGQLFGLPASVSTGNYGTPVFTIGQETSGPGFFNAPGAILQQAFDPQKALYKRTLGRLEQQGNSQLAQRGLANTPYGAAVQDNSLSNFNIDWQRALLGNMIEGSNAAANLYSSALGQIPSFAQPLETSGQISTQLENIGSQAQTAQNAQQLQASEFNAGQGMNLLSSGLSDVSGLVGLGK